MKPVEHDAAVVDRAADQVSAAGDEVAPGVLVWVGGGLRADQP
ncbi:MAG: hypothetical protein M5R40_11655 [Anaerolineae bacterium]|nr:hypothetical protein [Anaerolineae bacterium]